jgi:hypothetical protein
MSSLCTSALSSLDQSLDVLRESWEQLRAAKSVDLGEVIEQITRAGETARIVRESVRSELPDASWRNREELDALFAEIQKTIDARALEQLRSRLLALATELERGRIVHRRAHRVDELNQLRSQAINELRSQVALDGAPPTLSGPQADQWLGWACGLQESDDAETLQALRNGIPHLDDFVANLEPNLWVATSAPVFEVRPKPEIPADKAPPEQSRLEKKGAEEPVSSGPVPVKSAEVEPLAGRGKLRASDPRDELPSRGLESNTLTPHDVTPPRTQEDYLRIMAQESALLAGMMDLVSDPIGHFDPTVERSFTTTVFRETGPTPVRPGVAPTTPSSVSAKQSPQEGQGQ